MKKREELAFRKSRYSGNNGSCVEVADQGGGRFAIRDSKDPDGPILSFGTQDYAAFVRAAKKFALTV